MEDKNNILEVCRACLATGCKMFSMKQYNLEQTYALLTGISSVVFDETKMLQMVCFECVRRLQNIKKFSAESLTAWAFLKRLTEENKLTMADIKSIDRHQSLLTSKLVFTHFETNHSDFKFEEYEYENKDNVDVAINNLNEPIETLTNNIETNEVDISVFKNLREFDEESDKWEFDEPDDVPVPEASNKGVVDNEYCNRGRKNTMKEYNDLFLIKTMTPEEQREEVENRKKCCKYINAKFKCDKCYRGFQLEKPFSDHMKKHTNEFGEYVCDVCQSHFRKRALLVIHINKTHNKYISCRKCTFGTVFESTAIAHKNRHDGFRFQCKICPKHYSKRSTCVTHVRRCHPEDVVCHLCGASLPLVRDLDRHLRTTHRADELYLLPGTKSSRFGPIEKKKASSEYMAVTYSSTLPADASHCPACDIRFRDQGALLVHLSHSPSHGNPPKYKPSKSRGYTKKSYYEKKEAKLPVTYSCEQCGAQFAAYQSYHTHFRAEHPGQSAQYARTRPQFICEVCGKVYQTVYCLNDHRQSHSGQRAHSCAECGKTFTTKMALRTHRLDHTRSRECSVCGKVFSNVTNVQKHMRIHTRKPYACEPCNKRFCTPSERRAHIQHYHMGVPWPKRKPRGEGRREATLKSQADMEQATVEQNIQSAVKNLTPNTNFHSHFA